METTPVSRLTLSALLLGTLNCVPTPGIVVPPTSPMETVSGQSFLSIPFVAHLEDVGPCETAPPTSRQVRAVRVSSAWQPVARAWVWPCLRAFNTWMRCNSRRSCSGSPTNILRLSTEMFSATRA